MELIWTFLTADIGQEEAIGHEKCQGPITKTKQRGLSTSSQRGRLGKRKGSQRPVRLGDRSASSDGNNVKEQLGRGHRAGGTPRLRVTSGWGVFQVNRQLQKKGLLRNVRRGSREISIIT